MEVYICFFGMLSLLVTALLVQKRYYRMEIEALQEEFAKRTT